MSKKSSQDYLKAVYDHSRNGEAVSTTDISKTLKVAPASVTEMLKKMSAKGYVNYSPYHGSTLTEKGTKEAKKVARKHRLLERFLSDVLHIKGDQVHTQACEMEHALSDEAEESLCRFLKHPDKCPDDGKIIPACTLPFKTCEECIQLHNKGLEEVGKRKQNLLSICEVKSGSTVKVSFIRGGHRVLQRLLDMGLTPGTTIKVERCAPFNGPIEICVRGSKLALGRGIADNVFVEITEKTKK
ncbi:metal-dependent transcriptional regulator [Candidatus Bathyarchaeota archaeon]|nr:metal-dependent transcriptional regulator [Candidatus Bathyarchaeota archaeon]